MFVGIALDYETRVDPAALKTAGCTDVCRYLSWPNYWAGATHNSVNPKVIQPAEYRELVAAGVGVTLNWEYDAHDWLSGAAGGKAHGDQAARMAAALGYPRGCVIIGSADFDMTPGEWTGAGMAYGLTFAASVRAAGYEMGVYGPWDVLGWCQQTSGIRPGALWQCMSAAFSQSRNARPFPGAQLRQRRTVRVGGVQCDQSDIIAPQWGQHRAGGSDMEQADKVVGAYSRGNSVGDVLADAGNLRDWWYDPPGTPGGNPPPAGSRLALLYEAVTGDRLTPEALGRALALAGVTPAALVAELLAQLGVSQPAAAGQ